MLGAQSPIQMFLNPLILAWEFWTIAQLDRVGYQVGDLLQSISRPIEADKPMTTELAVAVMEELVRVAHLVVPLWIFNVGIDSDEDEYARRFPRRIGPKPFILK